MNFIGVISDSPLVSVAKTGFCLCYSCMYKYTSFNNLVLLWIKADVKE